ncbi:unnamed protein product [Clonostachys rhizophaga]|uniref:Cullin family profile domain-containing protein n=1 Tax=Clonostachys rhizophaga TaxID=160324 RepID=A0A9N9YIX3_9HYPO|nr:unnamed protein product [Clonostachys rhizophaga]
MQADSSPSSRRRPRLDSSSGSPFSASSPSFQPLKRPKFAAPSASAEAMQTMSAKARGKARDTIDLTRSSAFQPHNGAKRIVIKNLRQPGAAREAQVREYYAETEKILDDMLTVVLAGGKPHVPLERLYRGVEDHCRNGNAGKIHLVLRDRVDSHVSRVILPRVQRSGEGSNLNMAKQLLAEWHLFNAQIKLIRSIFSFLDRTYLLREKKTAINDMAITFFRKMAFPSNSEIYETAPGKKLVLGMCELIEHDRRGDELRDAELLKGSIRMLYVLGVYSRSFEPVFTKTSQLYFNEFGESHALSNLKSYIQACEKLLLKEHHRCLEFHIETVTEKQLMDAAHVTLIDNYTDKLLNGESFAKLLSSEDVESVKVLYGLLRHSRIQKKLKDPWVEYIKATVAQIVGDKDRGDEMVLRLLILRRSLDVMIRDAFGKDDEFLWAMRDAFGKTMNDSKVSVCWGSGTSKIGEMIAKHIDLLLRGGLKSLPPALFSDAKDRAAAQKEGISSTADEDAELDRQLNQSLELVRFIEGKDTFEAFYKKDLARRLLMGRSASQDAERNMLAKLRSEVGSEITHKLEQMFKDQEIARDEMSAYNQWCAANASRRSPVDLHVMVLSAAAWPTYPDVNLNLPDEVARQSERFDTFYKSMHTGRTLTWKHSLAHCSLKAKFPKGQKELLVSAYQAVVLLLFNSVDAPDGFLGYEQISKATGLKGGDLDRTLQSLACGKARVLKKHPMSREVKPTDTFTFNRAFAHPNVKVKINQIQLKETKEENKATHERVAQDRRFETQAAIVRIMKSRKQMGHAELQAEVINLTKSRGSVEPSAIKREIESLIEKDYIDREGNGYVYLA